MSDNEAMSNNDSQNPENIPSPAPAPIGSVPVAVGVGAAVAILGAVLWGLISSLTGYEVGYLALAIGFGVGYTVIGIAKLPSNQLAFTASALAIGGILLGKIFAVYFAGPAAIAQEWKTDPDLKAGVLMQYMYDEEKLSPEEKAIFEKFEANELYQVTEEEQLIIQGVAERVNAMSSSQEDEALKLMAKKVISTLSFSEMVQAQLGVFDILWVVLAIASAWKLCRKKEGI